MKKRLFLSSNLHEESLLVIESSIFGCWFTTTGASEFWDRERVSLHSLWPQISQCQQWIPTVPIYAFPALDFQQGKTRRQLRTKMAAGSSSKSMTAFLIKDTLKRFVIPHETFRRDNELTLFPRLFYSFSQALPPTKSKPSNYTSSPIPNPFNPYYTYQGLCSRKSGLWGWRLSCRSYRSWTYHVPSFPLYAKKWYERIRMVGPPPF